LFEILIGRVGNRGRRESFIDEVRRARKAGPAERPQATERRQLRPPGAIRAGFAALPGSIERERFCATRLTLQSK
jgi:hypothetical protein